MADTRISLRSKSAVALALSLLLPIAATASGEGPIPAAAPVAQVSTSAVAVDWQPLVDRGGGFTLTVSGPAGFWQRWKFAAGTAPTFSAFDAKGQSRPDGVYVWELMAMPAANGGAAETRPGSRAAARRVASPNLAPTVQSGAVAIFGGAILTPSAPVPEAAGVIEPEAAAARRNRITAEDQVILDDLIVGGAVCTTGGLPTLGRGGPACADGETSFQNYAALKLKGAVPGIDFEDTDFLNPDLQADDDWFLGTGDLSGPVERFFLYDIDTNTTPFIVRGGARDNALYVDPAGNVGIGTATPGAELHIHSTVGSAGIRLEQSAGFTSHLLASDNLGFFMNEGNTTTPFEIRAGAPSASLFLAANGDVGLGTASPVEKAHVFENVDANTLLTVENPNGGGAALGGLRSRSNVGMVSFQSHGSGRTLSRFGRVLGGWNEMLSVTGNGFAIGTLNATSLILGTNNSNRVEIGGAGGVTVTGNFTVTGGTKNFAVVDPDDDSRAIYYAALEGPEAGTYIRGAGRTAGGEATIVLPSSFGKVTEAEGVTIQLTAVGSWSRLNAAELGTGRVLVRVAPGDDDTEFHYLVQGVRKGYRDFAVERPNTLP
jgi:hypothetical protein